jgi:hypothetical protein
MSGRGGPPLEMWPERPTLQEGLRPFGDTGRAPGLRRTRVLALAFTVAAHLMVFTALFWLHAAPSSPQVEPVPIQVSLEALPTPPGPPNPAEIKDGGLPNLLQPVAPHLAAPTVVIASTPMPDTSDLLSDSQLAGAARAGEGGAGGSGCDMARAVQQALRRDPLVRAAVEDANRLGKAIMLWNGDWVRSGEQDGKGLSAVREAIMWEVAFAPEACRNQRVHGLVLLSLADGVTRFAIGSGDWRWSDLLGVRGVPPER